MIARVAAAVGWTWALILVLSVFEWLVPAERGQPLRHRLFNLAYIPFLAAVLAVFVRPASSWFQPSVVRLAGGGLLAQLPVPHHPAGQALFSIVFAIAWDVWRYWFHRLQHAVPFLWLSHRFHHTEPAVNASSHTRHHVLNFILSEVCYLPFLVVFGMLAPPVVVTFLMFRLWGFVIHLNVRMPFGPLTRWIAGPQWHRVHHSVEPAHQDKNFASFFPFIDALFGTYYEPVAGEYPRCGLAGEPPPRDLRESTVGPFLDALGMAARTAITTAEWLRTLAVERQRNDLSRTI